jgi:hypothetical protein
LTIPTGGHAPGAKSASAGSAETAAPIPAPSQDLDSGLKSAPANPVPLIRIDPNAPPSNPPPQP